MMEKAQEEKVGQMISNLIKYIPEDQRKDLEKLFAYGEKMKKLGEQLKKEFWTRQDRDVFLKYLKGKKYREQMYNYEFLSKMNGLERERFKQEYLHDIILYDTIPLFEKIKGKKNTYEDLKNGTVVLDDGAVFDLQGKGISHEELEEISGMKVGYGVSINLDQNSLGSEGAGIISKIKLKGGSFLSLGENNIGPDGARMIAENLELQEGVFLDFQNNKIGEGGAKAIAENMKLRYGVGLYLLRNQIGDEGAEAISYMELVEGVRLRLSGNNISDRGAIVIAQNMTLKEGVMLDLSANNIGDEGAQAIMDNMTLKEGVTLNLQCPTISKEMRRKLKERERSYTYKFMDCHVLVGLC